MSFRFENRSKKNEKKNTKKKFAVVCNFGILSNWIQKREKPTRIKSKNEKNDRKKRTNTKQIENTSKKERKSSFFCNNFWCLPDLTQFDNFSSSQKGPQAALEALLHVRGSGRPWSFGENFNDDPHEYTKTAVQAAEDFEMILMIAKTMIAKTLS